MKLLKYKDKKFLWEQYSLNTEWGKIEAKDIENAQTSVKTHLGNEFKVYTPNFKDILKKFKRGPAVILPKDIGFITAYTGIGKNSIVVEAGSGTGYLTACLANISKKVYSYEIKKQFYETVQHNLKLLNLKNVVLKNQDISKGISVKESDVIILDLPDPEKCLSVCFNSLKRNGFLVCYLPQITQIQALLKSVSSEEFELEKIAEISEREWEFSKEKSRPKSHMLAHTAFLIFFRKI